MYLFIPFLDPEENMEGCPESPGLPTAYSGCTDFTTIFNYIEDSLAVYFTSITLNRLGSFIWQLQEGLV